MIRWLETLFLPSGLTLLAVVIGYQLVYMPMPIVPESSFFHLIASNFAFATAALTNLIMAFYLFKNISKPRSVHQPADLLFPILSLFIYASLVMQSQGPSQLSLLTLSLVSAGNIMISAATLRIGDSFSFFIYAPKTFEAHGLYRLLNHPIYVGEALVYLAFVLVHPTPVVILLYACLVVAQVLRAGREEQVLQAAHPNYRSGPCLDLYRFFLLRPSPRLRSTVAAVALTIGTLIHLGFSDSFLLFANNKLTPSQVAGSERLLKNAEVDGLGREETLVQNKRILTHLIEHPVPGLADSVYKELVAHSLRHIGNFGNSGLALAVLSAQFQIDRNAAPFLIRAVFESNRPDYVAQILGQLADTHPKTQMLLSEFEVGVFNKYGDKTIDGSTPRKVITLSRIVNELVINGEPITEYVTKRVDQISDYNYYARLQLTDCGKLAARLNTQTLWGPII